MEEGLDIDHRQPAPLPATERLPCSRSRRLSREGRLPLRPPRIRRRTLLYHISTNRHPIDTRQDLPPLSTTINSSRERARILPCLRSHLPTVIISNSKAITEVVTEISSSVSTTSNATTPSLIEGMAARAEREAQPAPAALSKPRPAASSILMLLLRLV